MTLRKAKSTPLCACTRICTSLRIRSKHVKVGASREMNKKKVNARRILSARIMPLCHAQSRMVDCALNRGLTKQRRTCLLLEKLENHITLQQYEEAGECHT